MLLTWGFAIIIGGLLSGINSFNAFRAKGAAINFSNRLLFTQRSALGQPHRNLDLFCLAPDDDSFLDSDVVEEMPTGFDVSQDESVDVPKANRELVWNAAVKSSVRVKEVGRTCEEYMRLPASECEINKMLSTII